MNDESVSSSLWLIRLLSLALLACLIVRAIPEVSAAYRLHLAELATPYIIVSPALVATWLFAEATLRRDGVQLSRLGLAILLPACSCALAVGNFPGLFLPSLEAAALFVLLLALIAALLSGRPATFGSRMAIVLFCGSVGAAWQVAAAPLIATLLIHP